MSRIRASRLNQYRNMWVLVFFDLPTETKVQRKAAHDFRQVLLKDGFLMFQYSVYMRFCVSREHAETHRNRVRRQIPADGFVTILLITDRQYGLMDLFRGAAPAQPEAAPKQLELF
jgi:CRISPR-associated protein Cas2